MSLPQYRIFTVKQLVKDVADVTGLKLRSTGGAQDLTPSGDRRGAGVHGGAGRL